MEDNAQERGEEASADVLVDGCTVPMASGFMHLPYDRQLASSSLCGASIDGRNEIEQLETVCEVAIINARSRMTCSAPRLA